MPYYPHQLTVRPNELVGQWILTSDESAVPPGWPAVSSGRWLLAYSSPLTCLTLRDTTGKACGWLLGDAIDERGVFLRESPAALPAGTCMGDVADRLNGRFIVIDHRGPAPMVFPDAMASLAAVFSAEVSAVASTSSMIRRSDRTPFDLERVLATDVPYRDAMYPLGLTPRRGIERLLPNHSLDCERWELARRWPTGPLVRDTDPAAFVRDLSGTLRATLESVSRVLPLNLALTAGYDTRMMLACARTTLDSSIFFTADAGDIDAWRDVTIAQRIAARHGLSHRVQRERSSRSDLRTWVVRTGGESGEPRGWRATRALADQHEGRATITGLAADLARIGGLRRKALARPLTPENVVAYCRVNPRPEFLERAAQWLGSLPPMDALTSADLLFLEQRKGCWAGVIAYGELGNSSTRLSPVTSRTLVDAALRLPLEYRLANLMHTDVIRGFWPELLEFPFNEDLPVPPARSRFFGVKTRVTSAFEGQDRLVRRTLTRLTRGNGSSDRSAAS